MSCIIGLDASLTKMGYCLLDADTKEVRVKKIGCYTTDMMGLVRLDRVMGALDDIVAKESLVLCCSEEYAYNPFGSTSIYQIGEAIGQVKLWFYRKKIPMLRVQPTTLKLFATGTGRAQKIDIIRAVNSRYGLGLEDGTREIPQELLKRKGRKQYYPAEDDKADAFVQALVGRMFYRVWTKKDELKKYEDRERDIYTRVLLTAKEFFL